MQSIGYLRRVMAPSMDESTAKVISIRHVNNNQPYLLCCVETPQGAKIGIVKSLAMMSSITCQNSSQIDVIKNIIKTLDYIKHPYDINPLEMNLWVKILLNGNWAGVIKMSKSIENCQNISKIG